MAYPGFRQSICPILVWTYAVACVLSLLLVPASLYGWFGLERDPLSGVFAALLGMPWVLLLSLVVDPEGPVTGFLFIAVCLTLNLLILRAICRYFRASRP